MDRANDELTHFPIACIIIRIAVVWFPLLIKILTEIEYWYWFLHSSLTFLTSSLLAPYYVIGLIGELFQEKRLESQISYRARLCQAKFLSGETIRRARFSLPSENSSLYARRKISPNKG